MLIRKLIFLFIVFPAYGKDLACGVSTIPDDAVQSGCGCGYWLKTKTDLVPLLQSDLSFANPKMYIENTLVLVTPVSVQQIPDNAKAGNIFKQEYQYKNTKIQFKNVVTACPAGAGQCEATSFRTTLSITSPSCTVKDVEISGDCGC
jgi:hypothetical protein